ncbi:MAG: regulator [Burkholderiales bacterium]|nr:regulator [Burkholderiales bacterium]
MTSLFDTLRRPSATAGPTALAVTWTLALLLLLATAGSAAAQGVATATSGASAAAASPAVTAPDTSGVLAVQEVFEVGNSVYVRALAVEPSRGALWVGTSAGVHEVDLGDGHLRQTFTRDHGLANEYVFAIGIDKLGRKWFGTNAGGVSRYQETAPAAPVAPRAGKKPAPAPAAIGATGADPRWTTFFPMHGLADYWVYAFAEQKSGDLWIGTWAGANKVDARTGKFTTYVKQLVNEWVYGIAVDARDHVWFGTEGGVTRFDGKTWKSWTHADGLGAGNDEALPVSANTGLGTRKRHDLSVSSGGRGSYNPNYVFAMLAARDGSIWAGTWGGGAARFDGQRWTNLNRRDGLAGNIVYAILQDSSGALWFGTDQGVSRYDGQHWSSVARTQGLPDDHVYALALNPDGSVWAGTRGGVARIGWTARKP